MNCFYKNILNNMNKKLLILRFSKVRSYSSIRVGGKINNYINFVLNDKQS